MNCEGIPSYIAIIGSSSQEKAITAAIKNFPGKNILPVTIHPEEQQIKRRLETIPNLNAVIIVGPPPTPEIQQTLKDIVLCIGHIPDETSQDSKTLFPSLTLEENETHSLRHFLERLCS